MERLTLIFILILYSTFNRLLLAKVFVNSYSWWKNVTSVFQVKSRFEYWVRFVRFISGERSFNYANNLTHLDLEELQVVYVFQSSSRVWLFTATMTVTVFTSFYEVFDETILSPVMVQLHETTVLTLSELADWTKTWKNCILYFFNDQIARRDLTSSFAGPTQSGDVMKALYDSHLQRV